MVESSNVSSLVVQEGVNSHVSQLPNGYVSQLSNGHFSKVANGHVFQLSNGHVSQLPNGNAANLPNKHVSQSLRERLVAVLYREVSADMRKVDQFHRMSCDHWSSVRRLDNVEKAVRLRLMMKETEVKIAEKNVFIRRLRRNRAVDVNLLLEAALKYVGVFGFLCMLVVSMVGYLCSVYELGVCKLYVACSCSMVRWKVVLDHHLFYKNRFPLVVKDRLLTVFNEEVGGDVTVIREYRGIVYGLRISMRKREQFIRDLKALGNRQGVAETVRFMKGLQADEMDRCNRTLALMREVKVKARENSREISNDVRQGTYINALCARLTVIVDERVNFISELDMLAPEFVPIKMAELMKQIHDKDIRNLMKLQRLGREFELRGQEKEIFIQKLKGTTDF
nr:hypothetical protein [Tanacetum cinerariifolium]